MASEVGDMLDVADLTDRLLSALAQPGADGLAPDRFKTDLRALDARVLAKLNGAVAPRFPRRLHLVESVDQ